MNLLLDGSVPVGVRDQLPRHTVRTVRTVRTVPEMGWAGLGNGELLNAAEQAGFDALVTGNKNIVSQRSMVGRKIALIVLSTHYWPTIKEHPELISTALAGAQDGAYVTVSFPRAPLRRRPFSPQGP